jgi:hypothetical protein
LLGSDREGFVGRRAGRPLAGRGLQLGGRGETITHNIAAIAGRLAGVLSLAAFAPIEERVFSMAVYPVSMVLIVGVVTVLVLIPNRARGNDGHGTI